MTVTFKPQALIHTLGLEQLIVNADAVHAGGEMELQWVPGADPRQLHTGHVAWQLDGNYRTKFYFHLSDVRPPSNQDSASATSRTSATA